MTEGSIDRYIHAGRAASDGLEAAADFDFSLPSVRQWGSDSLPVRPHPPQRLCLLLNVRIPPHALCKAIFHRPA